MITKKVPQLSHCILISVIRQLPLILASKFKSLIHMSKLKQKMVMRFKILTR